MKVVVPRPFPCCCFFFPHRKHLHKTERHKTMEICVETSDGEKYTVDVGVDDTIADIRQKVASAAELCEDSFDMSFGGKVLADGDDTTQLSAGDTVVLTKTKSQKYDAIAALRDLGETMLTTDRFEGLTDPMLLHLFLQAEVVAQIPSGFLSRGTFEELDLSGVPAVTHILAYFLQDCYSLHTVDLSGWSSVTQIGTSFLQNCTELRTADLSGWNSVTHIGNAFFYNCVSLTTVDLSGWSSVTHIRMHFLYDCRALRTLDLSGWASVTHIRNCFAALCSSLTTLDLSGWKNVTQIEDYFLYNCTALQTLDLSGWNSVTHIPYYFLYNCKALRTLDLSGWASVTHIGKGVLDGCDLRKCSINVTGSSSVLSEYVQRRIKGQCVCM